jgi:hypothetical protein
MYTTTQHLEDRWDDYFAKSDSNSERYANEIRDLRTYEESEREYYEYMYKVQEAGFGDDCDSYEASWLRAMNYWKNYEHITDK